MTQDEHLYFPLVSYGICSIFETLNFIIPWQLKNLCLNQNLWVEKAKR